MAPMLQMQLRLLIATVDNNLTLLPTLLQVLSFAVSYLDILSRHQTYIVYLKKNSIYSHRQLF